MISRSLGRLWCKKDRKGEKGLTEEKPRYSGKKSEAKNSTSFIYKNFGKLSGGE